MGSQRSRGDLEQYGRLCEELFAQLFSGHGQFLCAHKQSRAEHHGEQAGWSIIRSYDGRLIHGFVQAERSNLQILRVGHKGRRYALWSGPALTSWWHSIRAGLVYGVLGRDELSPTRDQTQVCLHGHTKAQRRL